MGFSVDYNRLQRELLEERLKNLHVRDDNVLKKMEIVLENQKRQMEIERKMDLILEKLQSRIEEILKRQDQMEEKIKTLTKMTQTEELLKRQIQTEDKIEVLTENIMQMNSEKSKETKEILDVIETNLGWMDYFSEENDRFEKQIGQMHAKMEQLSQSQLETKEQHTELVAKLETCGHIAAKTDIILSEIKYVKLVISDPMFECNCGFFSPKEPLLREDGVSIECPKCKRLQIVGRLYERRKWMCHEKCGHYQQYPYYTSEGDDEKCQICGQTSTRRDLVLKCFICKSVPPKNLPLREDGVSVLCSKCQCTNTIGTLKEGQKWMIMSDCLHFLQVPLDKEAGTKKKCPYCGIEGILYDARNWVQSYS